MVALRRLLLHKYAKLFCTFNAIHICALFGCSRFRVRVDGLHEMVQYGLCTLARAATRLVGENLHTPFGEGGCELSSPYRAVGVEIIFFNDMIVQIRSPTFTIVMYESAMKTPRALCVSFCALRQTQSEATCRGNAASIFHYDE